MADVLQDTDLIMVNRGGTNYKLTGAELKQHDRLQDSDLVMVQESGALYKVSIGTLKSSASSLISGPTNFFLAERGDQLFSVENPFRRVALPVFVFEIDTSGRTSSENAFSFKYEGASDLDGTPAQVIWLKSDNTPAGIDDYISGSGTKAYSVNAVDGKGGVKVLIVGQFTTVSFAQSKALTTVSFKGGTNGWNRMFPTPGAQNGRYLFEFSPKLTHVFGMTGYGDAPPAGIFKDLTGCFNSCTSFDGDISSWNTGEVTSMKNLFYGASIFNQDIESWDVSAVTDFSHAFSDATLYNQPLNGWNVSAAKTLSSMFFQAVAFNKPLNNWTLTAMNAAPVDKSAMDSMFRNATLFQQNLTSWCVSEFAGAPNLFSTGSAMTTGLYPVWGTCP